MKQALGRATRNDHDWAMYFFLKNSVSQYLTTSDSFDQFPTNVQEEISFGVDVSSKPVEEIIKVCNSFLRGKLGEIGFPQTGNFSRQHSVRNQQRGGRGNWIFGKSYL